MKTNFCVAKIRSETCFKIATDEKMVKINNSHVIPDNNYLLLKRESGIHKITYWRIQNAKEIIKTSC